MANYDDTGTVSGSIVRVNDGADSVPIKNWLVTLPASLDGYTEVNGVRTGKNLWNVSAITNTTNPNNATIVNNGDGSITVTTTTQQNVKSTQKLKDLCPSIKVGETYFLSATTTGTQKIIYLHQAGISWTYGSAKVITTQMLESDVSFYASGTNSTATISDFQICVGSTATAYESYTAPTTYTASLGRTVYGGTADIVTGEGSADGAVVTLDDTMSYGINLGTDTNRIAVTFYNSVGKINGTFASNVLTVGENSSDGYKSEPWVIWGSTSAARMWISVPTTIDTVDKFKQYLQNNTITIAYELATPTDFTFDPVTIETAKGSNTLWSDQGNTELTYYKDGYGFTSVTVHKETPDGEPVEETRKLHRIIYEGQVDVINGTGLIYRGESGTQYDPPEQISFTPIEIATDEGENTLYADEGDSAITYRKAVD